MSMIRIVEPCGHSVVGEWKNEYEKGVICWNFERGTEAEIEWPPTIHCRHCKRIFTREQIKKLWNQPIYFTRHDNSFNCGCVGIDSGD